MLYLERRGRGPAALLVHGFPLDHRMWAAQVDALSARATCLVPDLAGFGRSAGAGGPLSMERHADDLARVLDAEDVERADVIALSMGGYAALAMWERHPERFRSLVLVDTKSAADDADGKRGRDAAALRLVADGRGAFARGMLSKLVAESASSLVRARLLSMMEATPYESIVGALAGMRDRPDRTTLLATVDVPALVICGEDDALTPPEVSRTMASALPRGALAVIPGAGHMAPMEAPDAVNAALQSHLDALPG